MIYPNTPETLAFDARIENVRQHLKNKEQAEAEKSALQQALAIRRYVGEQQLLMKRIKAVLDCPEELLQENDECVVPTVTLSLYGVTIDYSFRSRGEWANSSEEWDDSEIPEEVKFAAIPTVKEKWQISNKQQSNLTASEMKTWTGKLLAKAKDEYVNVVETFHKACADHEAAEAEIKEIYASYWQNKNEWKTITLYQWTWSDPREGDAADGWATTDTPDDRGFVRILPIGDGADCRYLKLEGTPFPVQELIVESIEQLPFGLYTVVTHQLQGYRKYTFWTPSLEKIQLIEKAPEHSYILPIQEIIPTPAIVELLGNPETEATMSKLTEREFYEISSGWDCLLGIDVPPIEEFEAIWQASVDNTDDLTRCLKSLENLKAIFSTKGSRRATKCTEKAIAIFKARLNALT